MGFASCGRTSRTSAGHHRPKAKRHPAGAGTEYKDYVYDILDILISGKDLENYIYDDMFVGAMGLGPSELAQREISALCESIEKAYKLYSKS